jgi:hypothetical protein
MSRIISFAFSCMTQYQANLSVNGLQNKLLNNKAAPEQRRLAASQQMTPRRGAAEFLAATSSRKSNDQMQLFTPGGHSSSEDLYFAQWHRYSKRRASSNNRESCEHLMKLSVNTMLVDSTTAKRTAKLAFFHVQTTSSHAASELPSWTGETTIPTAIPSEC